MGSRFYVRPTSSTTSISYANLNYSLGAQTILAPISTSMSPAYLFLSRWLVQLSSNQISIPPHSLQTFPIDTRR